MKNYELIGLSAADAEKAANYLESLGKGWADYVEFTGICFNLKTHLESTGVAPEVSSVCEDAIMAYAVGWPKHSGNAVFPVPGGRKAYKDAEFSCNLWANTQYGNDRRELCLYIAERIRAELEETNNG